MSDSSFDRAKKAGKVTDNIVSSMVKNGPRIERDLNIRTNENGKTINKMVSIPAHQSYEISGLNNHIYYVPSTTPSATIFSAGGRVEILVRGQSAEKLKDAKLRFRLAEVGGANSVTVIPGPYLIDRLEVWADGGSGDLIQTLYGDNLMFNLSYLNTEQLTGIGKNALLTTAFAVDSTATIAASGAIDVYVELIGLFTEQVHPFMFNKNGDILFRFYMRSGVVSSGTGTLNLTEMELSFQHEDLPDHDKQFHIMEYENKIFRNTFLDVIPVSGTYSMAANVETKVSLENVVGKVAYLAFCVRSSVSATSAGLVTYSNLVDTATIDILSSTNSPVLGHGTKLKGKELRNSVFNKLWPSTMSNNVAVYFIPFTSDPVKAMQGIIEHYFYFDGSKFQLSITPGTGFSTASYVIDVYAYVHKQCFENKGRLSVRW